MINELPFNFEMFVSLRNCLLNFCSVLLQFIVVVAFKFHLILSKPLYYGVEEIEYDISKIPILWFLFHSYISGPHQSSNIFFIDCEFQFRNQTRFRIHLWNRRYEHFRRILTVQTAPFSTDQCQNINTYPLKSTV